MHLKYCLFQGSQLRIQYTYCVSIFHWGIFIVSDLMYIHLIKDLPLLCIYTCPVWMCTYLYVIQARRNVIIFLEGINRKHLKRKKVLLLLVPKLEEPLHWSPAPFLLPPHHSKILKDGWGKIHSQFCF